ncbi:ABC transporter permease [Pseudoclavibacter chungangensis]|uniref:ABC transporter permease n=1 Tax=Pseudoclavibacter chungangensis TaxID=587635 RepID=A0A7J5BPL1_9MICO|nr:ABC transporter permease [Pseudoclavibacter chungangensis]KAB1654831.1 ABC transporter permease [Pseudoclavibacter chungangensis]NYJ68046.1 peptide/nickel transport system permease protein [Pseudoclavibacter chungangensis]
MRYVLGRIGQALIVLLVAFTAAFVLLQAMPGDAIMIKFENPELGLSQEQIAALRESYGADTPLLTQYVHTLFGFLGGDFGYSIQNGTPVKQLLGAVLPNTLLLAVLGFIAAVVLAVLVALLASLPAFAKVAEFIRALPSLFIAVPVFWLAIVLIQVFSFQLRLVPVINPGPIEGLILPVLTLAVPISAPLAQILIRSIDEVRAQPFIAVVRAKGASPWWILSRNVAKNAMLPTLTMAGVLFGELIAGAVVTETVFGRSGIGRITEQAVTNQDTPVLQAVVIVSAFAFVAINLVVDLLYPVLDPRLARTQGRRA